MTSRYEATLNGTELSDISSKILILDISYAQPQIRTDTYTSARRHGSRVYRRYYGKSSVTISFEIHEYDTADRMEICNLVQQWAMNGGVLQTSDREGQKLRCICDAFPVINSAMKWTEALSVTFSAYAIPFWENTTETVLTLTGTDTSGTLSVPGCVEEAPVEVEVTAAETITSISLTANDRTLSLSGISIAANAKITITYDDNMIQSIKTGNTSLLDKRTGVDDLLAECGHTNSFAFESDGACTVKFKVRGLWL